MRETVNGNARGQTLREASHSASGFIPRGLARLRVPPLRLQSTLYLAWSRIYMFVTETVKKLRCVKKMSSVYSTVSQIRNRKSPM